MDPSSLAAVALAGNILQFIEFGANLLSKANQIRKDGSTTENIRLNIVTKDLSRHIKSLSSSLEEQQREVRVLDEDEAALQEICSGCLEVAQELETALKTFKSGEKVGKWRSYRQAFKSIWGKSRVVELNERLSAYSSQIDRRLLASMRTRASFAFLEQAAQLEDANIGIKIALERLETIEQTSKQSSEALILKNEKILAVVETDALENQTIHSATQAVVI